ncbi:uncharacterized protein LOC110975567 isoform X2 [Acanthaster planci]|nr:uncharacterized protein LOC110975567 isoform X2 [Acanthaster planci]XP_022083841.1 uncharacterized protein LOC110975567 isoform X2 [Acanthaster planci]XP_022083843.1 uncharacterized protein LOC110975567 isoform X2 [Acanthaster planci]
MRPYLPLIAIAICILGMVLSVQAGSGSRPAVYKNWPECTRDTEFVLVVKKSEREAGVRYHERHVTRKKGRTVKYYECMPCTRCAPGVHEEKPCSVHADTACSATECTVSGCILDANLHACRLPGDPNDFSDMSAMMDPCDPTKIKSTTTVEPSSRSPRPGVKQLVKKDSNTSLSKGDQRDAPPDERAESPAPLMDGPTVGKIGIILAVSIVCVVLVTAIAVTAVVYASKRRNGCSCNSPRGRSGTPV